MTRINFKAYEKKLEHGYKLHARYDSLDRVVSMFVLPEHCFMCGSDIKVSYDDDDHGYCPKCLFQFEAMNVNGYEEPYFKSKKG